MTGSLPSAAGSCSWLPAARTSPWDAPPPGHTASPSAGLYHGFQSLACFHPQKQRWCSGFVPIQSRQKSVGLPEAVRN